MTTSTLLAMLDSMTVLALLNDTSITIGRVHAHGIVAVAFVALLFRFVVWRRNRLPRAGAYIVSDLPNGLTAIECPKCGRRGRYRKSTLIERFGPDAPLPTVLNLLADCPKLREWSETAGTRIIGLAQPSAGLLARFPPRAGTLQQHKLV